MSKKTVKSKQLKVEVSIERDKHDSAYFIVYTASSNRPKFRSMVYTRRDNAIAGARTKCKREGWKISRWLK